LEGWEIFFGRKLENGKMAFDQSRKDLEVSPTALEHNIPVNSQ
jgi:hypothetical protein